MQMNAIKHRRTPPFVIVLLTCLFVTAAPALASPTITATGIAHVTETSATLTASVDPNAVKVKTFHFEYISLADYEAAGDSFGTGTLTTSDVEIPATVKGTGTVTDGSTQITG